jgi:hypothetical protein
MAHYLLVHGAWGGGWVWDDVAPPGGPRPPGDGRRPAAQRRDRSRRVGRSPLRRRTRPAGPRRHRPSGRSAAIRHSVYVAAFWPERGQSLLDLAGGGPLPAWIEPRDDGSLAVTRDLDTVREALCADLSREQAAAFHDRLVLQSVAALTTPSTAPERGHPTTYVVCAQESDNSIPVAAQEAMASRAERVVRLSSAHMA